MTQRRVVYIGNFAPEHSTESNVRDTLRDMGHKVYEVQEDAPFCGDQARQALDFGPDLLLYTRTWGFGGSHQLLDIYRLAGVPTASVHLDLFFGTHRESLVHGDALFRTDHVFTADGGHENDFALAGVNHHFLPPAILKSSCYLADTWDPRDTIDVLFVGCPQPPYHPEWPWRGQLLDALRKHYGGRFSHRGATRDDTIRGHKLNQLYAGAKVVVGDSLMLGPMYWSDRIPETLGRGGILTTTCPDFEATFPAMQASVGPTCPTSAFIPDVKAAIDSVDYLLRLPDDIRGEMRTRAVDNVREHGTYHARMQTILDTVFGPDDGPGWETPVPGPYGSLNIQTMKLTRIEPDDGPVHPAD